MYIFFLYSFHGIATSWTKIDGLSCLYPVQKLHSKAEVMPTSTAGAVVCASGPVALCQLLPAFPPEHPFPTLG